MKLAISEILIKVSQLPDVQSKIDHLRKNDNFALREILKYCYDPRIQWALPPGKPPYKECEFFDQEGMLPNSMKKMYLFMQGGNPGLKQVKREKLFLDLLESISKTDAELLLAVKDRIMPYPGIDVHLVNDAFPGLLPPESIPVSVIEKVVETVTEPVVKPKKPVKKKKTKE